MAFVIALQGLLLTAAALSSSSQCKNRGFLLAMSAVPTFCTLALVCHKDATIRRLQRVIVVETVAQKAFRQRAAELRSKGKFFGETNDYSNRSTLFAPSLSKSPFTATTWVALAISIFGVLCLVAIDRLLCHSS